MTFYFDVYDTSTEDEHAVLLGQDTNIDEARKFAVGVRLYQIVRAGSVEETGCCATCAGDGRVIDPAFPLATSYEEKLFNGPPTLLDCPDCTVTP